MGMVLVNYTLAMNAQDEGDDPSWLLLATYALSGKRAAIFVILAGIGITLMTRKTHLASETAKDTREMVIMRVHDRLILGKRALFLFIAGLLYYPLWPADILHYYGVWLLVAIPLLFVSNWVLLAGAGLSLLIAYVLLFTVDYEIGWDWDTLEYAGFWRPDGFVRNMFYNGFHPVFPWLGFLFLGM